MGEEDRGSHGNPRLRVDARVKGLISLDAFQAQMSSLSLLLNSFASQLYPFFFFSGVNSRSSDHLP